jgi:hypothetical protein
MKPRKKIASKRPTISDIVSNGTQSAGAVIGAAAPA